MQSAPQAEPKVQKPTLTGSMTVRLERILTAAKSLPYAGLILIGVGVLLAIALRISLLDFKSIDFFHYTKGWYNTIRDQGFQAFHADFYNYNPPYLYLLYLVFRFFPGLSAVIATKLPSLVSDFVCAGFVYKIVRLKSTKGPLPSFAAFAVLFAPTVILNSAVWGQADSLYTTALVACLYFLLGKRYSLAFLAFGLGFAFKLQAIFLLPLLISLLIKKELSWKYFFLIPVVLVLALIPAWLAGRPIADLATIYLSQANQYGNNAELALNAPTFYTWLPQSHPIFDLFLPAGLLLAASIVFLYIFTIFESRSTISSSHLIELSLAILLLMPFFLPKMHDRYFYPADVFSIIFAFYFPKYFFIPLATSAISFFAYQPFLFSQEPIPMPFLAVAVFVTICIVMHRVIHDLFSPQNAFDESGAKPPT
jgi:Gpi18-like mannosyltransferase